MEKRETDTRKEDKRRKRNELGNTVPFVEQFGQVRTSDLARP